MTDLNNHIVLKRHKIEINKYSLCIFNEIEGAEYMYPIIHEFEHPGEHDSLEIYIASPGGYLHSTMILMNAIHNNFAAANVTSIIDDHAYSAAGILFLGCGDTKIIYPHSTLLIHDYSGFAYGKGGAELETGATKDKDYARLILDKYAFPFLSKKEKKAVLQGLDIYMNAKQMCERGMATHICINGQMQEASTYA